MAPQATQHQPKPGDAVSAAYASKLAILRSRRWARGGVVVHVALPPVGVMWCRGLPSGTAGGRTPDRGAAGGG